MPFNLENSSYGYKNKPFCMILSHGKNKLCCDANNAVGLSKQRKVGLNWLEFLFLEFPLRYLRPSILYSLPCDRNVQRAYWL